MELSTAGLILIGIVSGVLLGGGGMFVWLSKLNKSLAAKDSTEKLLYSAVSQETLQEFSMLAHRVFDLVESNGTKVQQAILDSAQFMGDVTDGLPNVSREGTDNATFPPAR